MSHIKKPDWLKIKLGGSEQFTRTKQIVDMHCLHTICSNGRCPNMGECWDRGVATFMIAGDICTRSCKFCNTKTGKPLPLNPEEPINVARSIQLMGVKHAVVTSVDRDDLPDLGASHWIQTINTIREINPNTTLEVLIPDFQGKQYLIESVCDSDPDIVSHNMETVRSLTPKIRSAAKYDLSLSVLKFISEKGSKAKSGIMLGLGETIDEVYSLMDDLLTARCYSLTMGQYLQPSRGHIPVKEYITPDMFDELKTVALNKGFRQVVSGPLVRSSYYKEDAIL